MGRDKVQLCDVLHRRMFLVKSSHIEYILHLWCIWSLWDSYKLY
uniref:Uncharacterized protein n=1 Tax=Anguilla anguilla TaxID=7936 RepID=A0A0E9RSP1_ANGAN